MPQLFKASLRLVIIPKQGTRECASKCASDLEIEHREDLENQHVHRPVSKIAAAAPSYS